MGKEWCNRHQWGYEAESGCTYCQGEEEDRKTPLLPAPNFNPIQTIAEESLTNEEVYALTQFGIPVSDLKDPQQVANFKRLLQAINLGLGGSDGDSNKDDIDPWGTPI